MRLATVVACHSASWLPRVPMRTSRRASTGSATRAARRAGLGARERLDAAAWSAVGIRGFEPEQACQGVRIGDYGVRIAAERLQFFRRTQKEFLDHESRDILNAFARLGRKRGEFWREPFEFRPADVF